MKIIITKKYKFGLGLTNSKKITMQIVTVKKNFLKIEK
jgi:hypothetical protein